MAEERSRKFLAEVESELKPLEIAVNLAHWEASTAGTLEAQEKASDAETRLRLFLASKSRYQKIEEFLGSRELRDPLLRRQLELLALEHRPNQLPAEVIDDLVRRGNEIQAEFYTFRAQLEGLPVTNNEILDVLRSERDEARRKAAWEASKQIAPRVAARLLELVRRRNEAARSLGYRDYYAMRLKLAEIDEDDLMKVFAEIRRRTDEPFQVAKSEVDARLAARYGTQARSLRPWHYEDPFFQEPPLVEELRLDVHFKGRDLLAVADEFYNGIGLPIRDVLDRSDLYERPGKDQHAYCTNIDRAGDVRILCNLKDDDRWMGILLHELGHATYEKFIPDALPWVLRQPAHIAMTEAIAMFMDRLVYDVDWLEGAAGINLDDRAALGERAWRSLRFEMLLTARWVLVMTHFERTLYADPERGDLDSLWWDLVEDLQLVPRPENRDSPDWAAKIHLSVTPVYYHNYLLGELIASQLGAAIRREALAGAAARGFAGCDALGAFLRDRVFRPGASRHWQTVLESATGSKLTPEVFLDEFVNRSSPI
ncbi:MAG: M2 family metallopeptidase [Gemmatimonadota bacterium]|nr:MAG: M2 family metallopeptidase [Gemmatimonadota bacterium]